MAKCARFLSEIIDLVMLSLVIISWVKVTFITKIDADDGSHNLVTTTVNINTYAQIVESGAERDRTVDLLNAIQALSQLSYSPCADFKNIICDQGLSRVSHSVMRYQKDKTSNVLSTNCLVLSRWLPSVLSGWWGGFQVKSFG